MDESSKLSSDVSHLIGDMMTMQKQLAIKYELTEKNNGFMVVDPSSWGNIDDSYVQARIKALYGYACEEFAEALQELDFLQTNDVSPLDLYNQLRGKSFRVELIDALHFIIELMLVADCSPTFIQQSHAFFSVHDVSNSIDDEVGEYRIMDGSPSHYIQIRVKISQVIQRLGMVCHTLKNKPWKTTVTPTSIEELSQSIREAWSNIAELFVYVGLTIEDIFNLYCGKNEINRERQINEGK